jgi:mono/diheme cytochrome c family protein
MKKKWIIALSVLAGVLITLIVPLIVLATGAIDVGADVKPGLVERTIAPWAADQSVEKRASQEKNPYTGDAATIAAGLDHYHVNCVMCHGAPGVEPADLAKGLNPHAPSLNKGVFDMSDGELFWVIKHGLRMTPMPAFGPTQSDEEIWKIVAFVRHLPNLTPQERDSLRAM